MNRAALGRTASLVAAAAMLLPLSACIPVVVAGAAVGAGAGAYSFTDRRSIGAQADDKVIASRLDSRLADGLSDRAHVNVNVFNRKVLLTGEVPDQASKDKAVQIAKSADNVASVVDDLEIGGMTPISSRNNDAYITGKVKAELVSRKDLFANAYKVVTEKRVVYLMGRVTRDEGDRAAEATRNVSDVAQVVKVFDYLTPQELAQIQSNGAQ